MKGGVERVQERTFYAAKAVLVLRGYGRVSSGTVLPVYINGMSRVFGFAGCAVMVLCLSTADAAGGQALDTSVTIRAGTYAGIVVPVRKSAASRKESRFWRSTPSAAGRVVGWNPGRLPIAVAFHARRGVTPDDSTAFWRILRDMEQDVGMHLFEPVTLAVTDDPDDAIVIDTKDMPGSEGITLVTWSNNGSVYDARVYLRSRQTLHDPSVVVHEMLHALGFGHTSTWSSIMNASPGRMKLTAEDVAYVQLAFESRAESERIEMWDRIALAVERSSTPVPVIARYGVCDRTELGSVESGGGVRMKQIAGIGLVGFVVACSSGKPKGPDTIAVPPFAK